MIPTAKKLIHFLTALFVLYLAVSLVVPRGYAGPVSGTVVLALAAVGANRAIVWPLERLQARRAA